jgi:hypothetical protein
VLRPPVTLLAQSKRLSEAEFLAFARTLVWQSPALAAAFQEGIGSAQRTVMSGGQPQMLAGHEHQDAKRQRYAMPDVAATAHALMALNAVNNQVAMWGSLNQLPSLQHFLAQGRPETSTASLENAPHGPAGQSTSSTPSPGMQALKPMYSPKDLAQALASLSQAQQHQHPHAHKCAESRDAVEASQGRHDAFPGQSASSSKDSSDGSSPSTPPSRPAQPERAPPTDTSANVSQTNAARVVKEGVQKDGSQGSAAGGAWQGGSTAAPQQGPGAEDGSAHNKYCHFCQHIKVKRASSMIACENRGCNRRFCEHCLNTHVADPVCVCVCVRARTCVCAHACMPRAATRPYLPSANTRAHTHTHAHEKHTNTGPTHGHTRY